MNWRSILRTLAFFFIAHLGALVVVYREFDQALASGSLWIVLAPRFGWLTFLLGWLTYPVSKLSHFVSSNELISEVQFVLVLLNSLLWALLLTGALELGRGVWRRKRAHPSS